VKWKNVSPKNYPLLKKIMEIFFLDKSSRFYSIILNKRQMDFERYFSNNFFRVYESFSAQLLRACVNKSEQTVLLADYYPPPKGSSFENNIKRRVNVGLKRDALLVSCRLDSKSTDLLQLCDLILGAISYDLKLSDRLIDKPSELNKDLLKYFKILAKIASFSQNQKTDKLNVLHFSGKS